MKKNIITISRQFGSGGHTIGMKVAKDLGIPYYDQELVEKISEESGYAYEIVNDEDEEAPLRSRFVYNFVGRDPQGLSIPDRLWAAECRVIRETADQGPCVIIGRCADFLLKDRADVLKVFIHADMDYRCKRIVDRFGETREKPIHRIKEKDGKRAAHYRYYTGQKWGRAENYHISINSGEFGIDETARLIEQIVRDSE